MSSQAGSSSGSKVYPFKVVLLGEGCVGKTSIVVRYVEDTFVLKHVTTLQASFMQKKINISGKRVQLAIWDTAGQERFHALGPIYYRDSDGAVLVYDITDVDSFEKVKIWVKELKKMLGNDICLVIAGNKTDLENQRTVNAADVDSYAASVGAKHFQTSAKFNHNIDEMFFYLSERMIEVKDAERQKHCTKGNVVVVDSEAELPPTSTKTGCCG